MRGGHRVQTGSALAAQQLHEAGAKKDLARFGAKALARSRTPGAKAAGRALAASANPSKLAAASAWCAAHPVTVPQRPFAPKTFTGAGNATIRISAHVPAIVHIVTANASKRPFSVEAQDAHGQRTDLLANVLVAYDGVRPINLLKVQVTTRLVVQASSPWTIDVAPLSNATTTTQGHGDQVLLLGGGPTSITIDGNDTGGLLQVDAYGSHTQELASSLDPVHSHVRLSPLVNRVLVVQADSDWRVQPA